jgi:hypothetical protein
MEMDGPLEVDSRGKENSEHDPRYYVVTDKHGHVICDTLNCHYNFTQDEQRAALEDLVATWNRQAIAVAVCGMEPSPPQEPSPCAHSKTEFGFGLAGGGYGAYEYCVDCGHILHKTQTE